MKNTFAPALQQLVDEHWVLWYAKTNRYSVIDQQFQEHLSAYLQSKDTAQLASTLNYSLEDAQSVAVTMENYLNDCNTLHGPSEVTPIPYTEHTDGITSYYKTPQLSLVVHYPNEKVKQLIHPALAHLGCESLLQTDISFSIQMDDNALILYEDQQFVTRCHKSDYHLLQGKFAMRLICALYNSPEDDWIGTFHASTISDGHSALLIIGESGQGKSTLTTLLVANGFEFVADDVTPLLAKNRHIYRNPKAISVKQGAFDILKPFVPHLESLPAYQFSPKKGETKFISFKEHQSKDHYPCRTLIRVNYAANASTTLEGIPTVTALQILIPDSWLSPERKNAEQFLNWLTQLRCYDLSYSDFNEVKVLIQELLNEDRIFFLE